MKVVDQPWHAKCLSCASCAQPLREKCFVKNRSLLDKAMFTNWPWPLTQRCVLPRRLFPEVRDKMRRLPRGNRTKLSGQHFNFLSINFHVTFTSDIEPRLFWIERLCCRWGEPKSMSTTLIASSASSAQGNWWATAHAMKRWSGKRGGVDLSSRTANPTVKCYHIWYVLLRKQLLAPTGALVLMMVYY